MVAGSVGSWLAAVVVAPSMMVETLCGMLAPLLVAVVSWELAERTYRQSPERLTPLMVTAFAGKMVFFGGYVAVALLGFSLRPVPFVVSFTAYFIALHLVEALCLRRLFAEGSGGSRYAGRV
jgi:hypothetical protein